MPECDIGVNNREIQFDQPWLPNAIPYSNDQIDRCFRYVPKNQTETEYGKCSAEMFDKHVKIPCTEYVYASQERNLQTEVTLNKNQKWINFWLIDISVRSPLF